MVLKINEFVAAQYEGDQCEGGICKRLSKCPIAAMMVRSQGRHSYERCGFYRNEEIVCCLDLDNVTAMIDNPSRMGITTRATTTPTTMRKVDQACNEIIHGFPPPLGSHILHGELASLGEFPHMAGVGVIRERELEFPCGGTLISKRFILTAAHCVKTRDGPPTAVRLGVININAVADVHRKDYNVSEFFVHPDYKKATEKYNDIALLRLSEDVTFTEMLHPACLYTNFDDPSDKLIVTGWGVNNVAKNTVSDNLLKAGLMTTPLEMCKAEHESYMLDQLPRGIINTQMCAHDPNNKSDTCQGDSGGPLQLSTVIGGAYTVVGVTSFGAGCGTGSGVYTRVARYLDWIEPIVWP